ncbi:peptidase MA family metallohydrolase [Candidatus Desulforudis audaxviator]|uniref:Peptidase MA-like domain-containing protein n=1 Tax=Desulforudis audaxviator (strain MP104C) TaxID=477974 RepID=B1I6P2_DESAP|nr:peptidase MA family metallohydrolase [Candidatus Desulforudis audaxviator]ACA60690.1 conserved hypothetical protein [Candidatus Desulforudis audaxviator MP104C]AZK60774.1 hypothetical protein Daudx_2246 [Candidatus Desulforudis audaxviator]
MSRKARLVARLTLVSVLVSSLVLMKIPTVPNLYINSLIREINKRVLVWYSYSRGMDALSGERFIVFYHAGRQREAEMVLTAAEGFYPALAENFGLEIQGPVPVLLYDDRESLNKSFGWPADADTLGVYWAGSIRVLSPDAWINSADERDYYRVFAELGPMSHEIAHLFVDYLSMGNCPRWFNEGVAQYQEHRLTGFHFGEACSFPLEKAFSLEELAGFDTLEEQNRAYHQSFSIVSFLVETYGWPAVVSVLREFGRGADLEDGLKRVFGIDPNTLDGEWKRWVRYR